MSNEIHTQVKKTRKLTLEREKRFTYRGKINHFVIKTKKKSEIIKKKQTTTAENNHCEREKQKTNINESVTIHQCENKTHTQKQEKSK